MNIMKNRNTKANIPHGWVNCPTKSSLIAGLFVVSKTLLDGRYDNDVPAESRFNWKLLSDSVKSTYRKRIGMVIDLTNTDKFYNKNEVEREGCRYVKITCKGFNECPPENTVSEFNQIVGKFVKECPFHIISVHCTHGFNRSGFMLVSYLIDSLKMDLETSINTFAKARSPGIFKKDYLTELVKRYGRGNEQIKTPENPPWKINDNGTAGQERGRRFIPKVKNTKFMDGMIENVVNVSNPKDILEIQSIVMHMIGSKEHKFPGSQPVSLDVDTINKLTMKSYKVTWKADGQRYIMLIRGKNEIYMLDRDFAVYKVNTLKFPRRYDLHHQHVENTLLDGEMVIDKYPDHQRGRYLVYDIITFETQNLFMTSFVNRSNCILEEIINPRTAAYEKGLLDKARETFSIHRKEFFEITETRALLDGDFTKKLLHESDGLIFQPADDIYQFGHCTEILKWKPPELNTIDFRLTIENVVGGFPEGKLMVGGMKPSFAKIELTKNLLKFDNKIIECSWDFQKKVWKFLRLRTDKSYPNKFETAQSIVRSITNPVTKDHLYKIIDTQRYDLFRQGTSNNGHVSSNQETKAVKEHGHPHQSYQHHVHQPAIHHVHHPATHHVHHPVFHNVHHSALQGHHGDPRSSIPNTQVNNTNVSQVIMDRLNNSDPFGLCDEVETLIKKFPIPKEFDSILNDPIVGNHVSKRSNDPIGLMDSDDDDDGLSPEKKMKMN